MYILNVAPYKNFTELTNSKKVSLSSHLVDIMPDGVKRINKVSELTHTAMLIWRPLVVKYNGMQIETCSANTVLHTGMAYASADAQILD